MNFPIKAFLIGLVFSLSVVAFADQQSVSCSVSYMSVNGGAAVKGPSPQIFNTSGQYAPIIDRGLLYQAPLSMADA